MRSQALRFLLPTFCLFPTLPFVGGCDGASEDFAWAVQEEDASHVPYELEPIGGLYDLSGRLDPSAVEEVVAFDQEAGCVHPMDDCRADYVAFPDRAADQASFLEDPVLFDWILDLLEEPQHHQPVTDAEIADAVVDGLAIRFLLDGLANAPLRARIHAEGTESGYRSRRIVFEDPWVGDFGALLVLPDGPGPHPVVLAIHGHGTEARDFLDAYGALDYIGSGFALLAIEQRMTYANQAETDVGLHLLRHGFSLGGLHTYEAFRAHRYIRWHEALDPDRVVLLGHSAGAQKVDLMIRISDSFAAAVTDNTLEITVEDMPWFHAGFIPELAPWQDLLNDFSTAPVPTLKTGYGYPEGTAPIIDFMLDHVAL
jgi:hypothetical protein